MGLSARVLIALEFKLGIYQVRQVTRIEKGGIVISTVDSKFQPNAGVRHELTPDEWFLYSWNFFPQEYDEFNDEEFLLQECYYDYFQQADRRYFRSIYAIFRNDQYTGYIVTDSRYDKNRSYDGIRINEWGISKYRFRIDNMFRSPVEAAISALGDLDSFEKIKIDMYSLRDDCEKSPGSCALYDKLTQLLQKCKHSNLYLSKV